MSLGERRGDIFPDSDIVLEPGFCTELCDVSAGFRVAFASPVDWGSVKLPLN